MPSVKSIVLVSLQLGAMCGLLVTGPWIARQPAWLALEIAGCVLGAWAVVTIRLGNFGIFPEVRADRRLVTHGPYRVVRNPMYTAVLIAFGALVIDSFTPLRAAIWIVLAIDLVFKIAAEEKILRERFPDYAEYARRTKRLIPFVW